MMTLFNCEKVIFGTFALFRPFKAKNTKKLVKKVPKIITKKIFLHN